MADETTSDLRRGLCKVIVEVCMDRTRTDHAKLTGWLDGRLAVAPFTVMTDAELIAMARSLIVDADVDALIGRLSAVPFDGSETYLCPDCMDERLIPGERGGFVRCQRCNAIPEVDDGEITKRKARR